MPELTVIMPVYNEEAVIGNVVRQWAATLEKLGIDWEIAAYNDGSKDKTLQVLNQLKQIYPQLKVIDKPNGGHGPTILQGYRDHMDSPWIFQIDSDGELHPENFQELWANRHKFDFLIGRRIERQSPPPRQVTTWISRLLIWILYGRSVYDVNCPYRLFRPRLFQEHLKLIPPDTFAPNLILSGLAALLNIRIYQTEVVHTNRQTGEVSIKKWRLFKAAVISCWQTIIYRTQFII